MTDEDTLANRLGVGIHLDSDFDLRERGGSIGTVDGFDVLSRDLAFQFTQELDDLRGELAGSGELEFAEDLRIIVRRIARETDRIDRVVEPIDVEVGVDGPGTARIDVELVADTGERGEAILKA